ncbi:4-(cytidine 5'-diphospho)-2-C-methyl-D-erythritol kinase [Bosea caraganae]|uniref:4-diphosphocytidyl-2-C-methyl-D-erythritol kinase n=1 Tax=Bosea caraganae TaxID=2763117 RepID=A0A370L400_9HYPH|nr:4-(cytidine 5'-diphospho)-2-C-methyl-D-erythritol kinase [Bosea caraganae]RDJ24414.1 4-(cytidine 5'-diphospho)-2-C-methyl-D-erythritol kinase [Bosea caraganae]
MSPGTLTTHAPAKINLTLRVTGRRVDGYHELESLVAFAGVGDRLALLPDAPLGLTLSGPRSAGLTIGSDNLVLRAANALQERVPGLRLGAFHLVKNLPVASGIGGGSTDAAAALRLLARLNGLRLDDLALRDAARVTGADVPVCVEARARVMSGVGEVLGSALSLPRLFAVLVNPGVPVETAAVFRQLGLGKGEAHPAATQPFASSSSTSAADLIANLARAANDLEPPALGVAPVLESLLARLHHLPDCRLARMSGSGATCFALFDDCRKSARAARILSREQPGWWVKPTVLR